MDSKVLNAQTIKAQQANTKLSKTIEELNKTVSTLTAGAVAQSELIEAIATKEAELSALEVQFAEAKRQRQVDFELDLRADQLSKVAEVLTQQGKVAIGSTELTELRSQLATLSGNFNDKLATEVAAVKQAAQAGQAAAIRQKELELAATNAEIKAQVGSLTEKNVLLSKQIEDYKLQIAQDRDARIKEAQARGNPVVTVASGK